ncbi:hypothetical protein [Agromyces humatus]|uniref:Uncharacterized protein n=1 Tax=Agromyces humatus TaxID=279573 RepID=A0ABP4WUC2_9MICO|nr:hypothetical protein [Agromyces humatus]
MRALAAATRSWPMLAAVGAGLVLLAVAAGAGGIVQPAAAVFGVAALVWSILALRAGRLVAPAAALVACSVFLVGAGALVATGWVGRADVAAGPLVAASAFIVVVAASCALALRRARVTATAPARAARPDGPPAAGFDRRSLVGLVAGAALVAALATPALAATPAGGQAVPHGEHLEEPGGHAH